MTIHHAAKYMSLFATGLLISCGGGGGSTEGGSFTPPTPVVDVTNPVLSFSPNTLSVASGATAASTLSASDNVGIASGPTVSCTNGGSFASNIFTAPAVTVQTTSVCTATASDAAGNSGSATLTATVNPPVATTPVTITGKVTFDFVPHNTTTNGLNYAGTTQKPVRGASVEIVDASNTVLDTDVTTATGDYSVTVDSGTNVRVRVKAELLSTATAKWDVKVTDNTNNHAVYALQGSLTSSGAANSTRNLNASSGWGGTSYTSTRAAAPFAILDPIYQTVTDFAAVDSDVDFPAVEFRWSTRNRSGGGDLTDGLIGTSSYQRVAGVAQGNVYILGDAGNDTDEYDKHVVVHEWGHYFEDRMSRSDSVGGPHSSGNRLDPRVALGEGWGNALSGIILADPFYRDSGGPMQSQGFSIDVDNNTYTNTGWYNEGSVQSIIFDLFDANDDGSDSITLGLAPIYEVFTANTYIDQPLFTTIFGFISELKSQQAASTAGIDALVSAQSINGTDARATGETNAGGVTNSLPLYTAVTLNGPAVEVCSLTDNGTVNKLGIHQYLTVNLPSNGSYTFTMTKTSGAVSRDPDFNIFRGNAFVGRANSGDPDTETLSVNLQAGDHVIDAFEFNNTEPGTSGNSCFNFSVTG